MTTQQALRILSSFLGGGPQEKKIVDSYIRHREHKGIAESLTLALRELGLEHMIPPRKD